MKYKVGDMFWHPLAKVEGEITEKVSKDIFKLDWEDGDKLIVSKKDLDDDIENKCISLISRKPKKKKNKLKKRVKELEKEKEKVREFTFGISNFLDEQESRIKKIEERFERFDNSMLEKPKPVLTELEKIGIENVDKIKALQEDPETPNKKIINPDKTLEERLEELGSVVEFREYGIIDFIDVTFPGGQKVSIAHTGRTDNEIVEKVKQIIEILK